ncbi:MAG: transposase [Deltaproteobacteria bacterium]|nr:transposase [Deltaproteobacteria bacterium]
MNCELQLTFLLPVDTSKRMSRAWRIEYAGALYHLLSRGNEGRKIFRDNLDRNFFLATLGELSDRFDIDIYAFVLMDNHYHLLVQTHHANLKKAMHWFGTTYTQRFNWHHSRNGHLFQGRYKSIIVQNNAYMLRLSCYIHRNPLRAGIVNRLAEYRWSSYLTYAYGHTAPDWLATKMILSQFGNRENHRQYREKVQSYAKEEKRLWEDLRHGMLIGSKSFIKRIRKHHLPSEKNEGIPQQTSLAKVFDPTHALHVAERILRCEVQDFANTGRIYGEKKDKRDLMIFMLWNSGTITNQQIGHYFGISHSAVSHAVKSLKSRIKIKPELLAISNKLNSQFKL